MPPSACSSSIRTPARSSPPNLGRLEIHFRPGNGNTLFEIAFANKVTDVKVYARCALPMNGGCIYQPDPTVWAWIAETNRGGEALTISVKGTDDAGTAVGATQDNVDVSFAQDDIEGGLYYWRIGRNNDTAIMRYDFGTGTAQTQAEKFVGTEMTNGTCVGCHALSHDGTKLVAEAGGQNDGRLLLVDVAARRPMVPFASTPKAIFTSWAPDGSQFVGSDETGSDWNLRVYDGTTGAPRLVARRQQHRLREGRARKHAADVRKGRHHGREPQRQRLVGARRGGAGEERVEPLLPRLVAGQPISCLQ
jgi:hypothetical protein